MVKEFNAFEYKRQSDPQNEKLWREISPTNVRHCDVVVPLSGRDWFHAAVPATTFIDKYGHDLSSKVKKVWRPIPVEYPDFYSLDLESSKDAANVGDIFLKTDKDSRSCLLAVSKDNATFRYSELRDIIAAWRPRAATRVCPQGLLEKPKGWRELKGNETIEFGDYIYIGDRFMLAFGLIGLVARSYKSVIRSIALKPEDSSPETLTGDYEDAGSW